MQRASFSRGCALTCGGCPAGQTRGLFLTTRVLGEEMNDEMLPEKAAERIGEALDRMKEGEGHLESILEAFRGLLVEQARLRAELPAPDIGWFGGLEPERFARGIPLTDREDLIGIGKMWESGSKRLVPPMREGFPRIEEALGELLSAIGNGGFDPEAFVRAALTNRNREASEIAARSGLDPAVVKFALIHVARPFVAKRAEVLKPLIEALSWDKGYCPICGSLPEMSLLRDKEGRRWLRCGFCFNEWRFMRLMCPCCETQEAGQAEVLFVEGREHERLDLCHKCKKYVAEIDLRNLVSEPVLEVAALGLLHLDVVAQQRGFQPMGGSWWGVP